MNRFNSLMRIFLIKRKRNNANEKHVQFTTFQDAYNITQDFEKLTSVTILMYQVY